MDWIYNVLRICSIWIGEVLLLKIYLVGILFLVNSNDYRVQEALLLRWEVLPKSCNCFKLNACRLYFRPSNVEHCTMPQSLTDLP